MPKKSRELRKKQRARPKEANTYKPDPERDFYRMKIGGIFKPYGNGGGDLRFFDQKTLQVRVIAKQPMRADDPTPTITRAALEAPL